MNTNLLLRIAPFFAGLVLGVLGTVFLPAYVRPHLPEWVAGSSVVVTGTVAAKQKKDASLLLTVETPEGVLLATFRKKVDEIDLLISATDTIEFNLTRYKPFVDDPRIVRVAKGKQGVTVPAAAEKQESGKKEEKPVKKDGKPQTATPAPEPAPVSQATGT